MPELGTELKSPPGSKGHSFYPAPLAGFCADQCPCWVYPAKLQTPAGQPGVQQLPLWILPVLAYCLPDETASRATERGQSLLTLNPTTPGGSKPLPRADLSVPYHTACSAEQGLCTTPQGRQQHRPRRGGLPTAPNPLTRH